MNDLLMPNEFAQEMEKWKQVEFPYAGSEKWSAISSEICFGLNHLPDYDFPFRPAQDLERFV